MITRLATRALRATAAAYVAVAVGALAPLAQAAPASASQTSQNRAQIGTGTSPTCPDAGLFKGLMTRICWSCMFPIVIAGADMGSGEEAPPGAWADEHSFCTCPDAAGAPRPGIPVGMWKPIRLVEVVRVPYCSPSLGGVRLRDEHRLLGGFESQTGDTRDKTFYSYHYFAFPLTEMLDLLVNDRCNAGGYVDMDLMYLSEIDPLWVDDELAFFQAPEIAFVANPVAKAACFADAAAATADRPLSRLFWCAGGWGNLYPFSGNLATQHSPPQDTNLLATRALAKLHRQAQAWGTMGGENSCRSHIAPMLPKRQYKWSQFYPVAEAHNSHWIGESAFQWGEWRNIPATGEDFVHLLWTWNDCCFR